MVSRGDIIAEALSWRGTPVREQASLKGVAVDCKGLIVGVARAIGYPWADSLYAKMHSYRFSAIDTDLLSEGLDHGLDRGDRMQPADVLLLNMRAGRWEPRPGKPRHLAILVSETQIIHAYGLGPTVVSFTDLKPALRAWPLHQVYCWRGID